MSHNRSRWFFGAAVIVWLTNIHAMLAAVPYQFSGVVTSVADDLSSEFIVGESVSGRVLIESTPRPPCPICLGTTYDTASFEVTFGGDYILHSDTGVLIVHDETGLPFDQILFDTTAPLGLTGSPVNGHVPDDFVINLRYDPADLTGTRLLSQFAPGTSTLGDASGLRFDINDELKVDFIVNDFSVVPEPCELSILVSLAGALLMRHARANRRAR